MSAIRRLGQVALPAHNLDRAIAFYRDVLHLPFIWNNDHLAFFQVHDTRLLIEIPEAPEFDHPGSVLYFDVADIEGAVRDLEGRGVVFSTAPHHIGDIGSTAVWMAFFHDSEENLLALQCERPVSEKVEGAG